jgi:diaminohydroxyphosphoribosylaminopyrimidine deaminase/5-amino-6-(5-phosphoribosylamino)uracil reductase
MTIQEKFMQRCLQLARNGEGSVSPNPMVGCVIVHGDRIIGEGFHREPGGPHAEVHAIEAVADKNLLTGSTLYVNLEPCTHFGKTPPCSDLIIRSRIPRVVIGITDPFPSVAGKGIENLRNAGVAVETGILEQECRELNRRFLTFHQTGRPYIILKWARTMDGFMDTERNTPASGQPVRISGTLAHILVHRQRTTEDAILVGTHTAMNDDPELTAREWSGKNPLRMVIDRALKLPQTLKLFDNKHPTIVLNEIKGYREGNIRYEKIDFNDNLPRQILLKMSEWNLQSLVVEGGAFTLRQFIEHNLWDDAHIYTGKGYFFRGLKSPDLWGEVFATEELEETTLTVIRNRMVEL